MIIGSTLEERSKENRIAITPYIIKKYKSLGLKIHLRKGYATHLGISDKQYELEGATIIENDEEIISKSDVLIQMNIMTQVKRK